MTRKLRGLLETILVSMCKLNQIQFSAPWRTVGQGC